jgi:hypothetical protein
MATRDSTLSYGESGTTGPKPSDWYGTGAIDGDAGDFVQAPKGSSYQRVDLTNNLAQLPAYKTKADATDNDWAGLGVISETIARADFTDGGAAVGTYVMKTVIPAGAFVIQTLLQDVTGFTGDTSATVTIGDGTDVDRYNTGTPSLFTTAVVIEAGVPSGVKSHLVEKSVTVTVTSAADFTAVVAGSVTVKIYFFR